MKAHFHLAAGRTSGRARARVCIFVVILGGSVSCLNAAPAAPAPPCATGVFSVHAMVSALMPAQLRVERRPQGGAPAVPLTFGSTICDGDTLVFPDPRGGGAVELYEAGKFHTIKAEVGSETIGGGKKAVLDAAAAYVNAMFTARLDVLLKPRPTVTRGVESPPTDKVAQVRAIAPLRGLPHQKVVPETRLLVSWRDGADPYRCEASDGAGKVLWTMQDASMGRCELPAKLRGIATVVVREPSGRGASWYLEAAPPLAIPRPDWWIARAAESGTPERTAWAIWLWQNGGAEWRLQALGMLNAEASREFIAGYFVERVLAEDPPM